MKKELGLNVALLICSVLICLVIGESTVRLLGHTDPDGNFFFRSTRLKPYHLPITNIQKKVATFLATPTSFITYDPHLGWTHRPASKSDDGLYSINADGIRATSTEDRISKTPSEDTVRIAIFGDSFTFGAQAAFEDTWGYYLERNLTEAGINAEVLNFGVGGYGIDQAFLRWKETGQRFAPDIVLCGFQPENVKRNVNLIRPIYAPQAGIPFAKPRYILEEDQLQLINVPTPGPKDLVYLAENIESWDLIRYEYWLDAQNYERSIWLKSKLAALVAAALDQTDEGAAHGDREDSCYALDKEPAQVTLAIIRAFERDVALQGAQFYSVHLPQRRDLVRLLKEKPLPYEGLLDALATVALVIRPERAMLDEARKSNIEALFAGHYSAAGNRIVAETITEFIVKQYGNKAH